MTNLVELARQNYNRTSRPTYCRWCYCRIELRDGRWLSLASDHWCNPSALLIHQPKERS